MICVQTCGKSMKPNFCGRTDLLDNCIVTITDSWMVQVPKSIDSTLNSKSDTVTNAITRNGTKRTCSQDKNKITR